jgi:hypothetical protein
VGIAESSFPSSSATFTIGPGGKFPAFRKIIARASFQGLLDPIRALLVVVKETTGDGMHAIAVLPGDR